MTESNATTDSYSIVIPTIGRDSLLTLLYSLEVAAGPRPESIIVVFDRGAPAMEEFAERHGCHVRHSGGRGPAAARNVGWRATQSEWVVFLDDDVAVSGEWARRLHDDITHASRHCGGIQAQLTVPFTENRNPTDNERRTLGLETAHWITADMAYRRSALEEVGGFDEVFRRAYREDADIALRVISAGYTITVGSRLSLHPVAKAGFFASVKAQRGNADDAVMRYKFGRDWRTRIGEQPSRLPFHFTVAFSLITTMFAAVTGSRRLFPAAAGLWLSLTTRFTLQRIAAGPRQIPEWVQMAVTSALIPPVACLHRVLGEVKVRTGRVRPTAAPAPPAVKAILFDRDDTLIKDIPYLNDPAGVSPVPTATEAIQRARQAGLRLGIVTNQSGVARGLITLRQLVAVNERVTAELGPFDTWQICVHGEEDGCECRKPSPTMIRNAAAALGVAVEECVMIGDTGADVDAALRAGARAILVPTERTLRPEVSDALERAQVAEDLSTAVSLALRGGRV